MGTIDSAIITLVCPECGVTESSRVLDKGSGWGGSHWQRPTFATFETTITGTARTDYDVTGVCPACQVAGSVNHQYGT